MRWWPRCWPDRRRSAMPGAGGPEDALSYRSYDGLQIAPLYTAEDLPPGAGLEAAGLPGEPPFVRGIERRPAGLGRPAAGRAIRTRRPATERCWPSSPAERPRSGCSWSGPAAPVESLADSPGRGVPGAGAGGPGRRGRDRGRRRRRCCGWSSARGLAPAEVAGTLGADPIGHAARTGTAPDLGLLARLAAAAADFPRLLPATVDASVYSEAGGSDSDELAISVAVGVAYLRALTEAGLGIDDALGAAGIPVRGQRRPVGFDGQAPGRPPALGPGGRAVRCRGRQPRPAPACGHGGGDADPARSVGEPAAGDRRLLRRRRRRRRGDHGGAVRLRDRAARRLRTPDRPQHPVDPARRVQPGPGAGSRPVAPGTWSR